MDYTPRRKLTREFKLEAVRQTALSEKPKAQLARERASLCEVDRHR
jgi:transposase-like protein